ncbi:MAG TPA: glycosyltransferase, partial [Fimbriimonadaceae bacterium]|nr:glycosyltransferase [Fimbriimonadaceae bacterium]
GLGASILTAMKQVSVCLAVYNGADLLERALHSVQAQTYRDFEVLVLDDGSTDGSAALAEKFEVRLIRQQNQGLGAARRRLVEEAKGELIAFIDHDDEWLPEKLERQVAFHFKRRAVLSHTAAEYLDETGKGWIRRFPHREDTSPWEQVALAGCRIIASTVVFSREAMLAAGNFDPEVRLASDWYGWFQLAAAGPFAYLDEPLARYRVRSDASSASSGRFHRAEEFLIEQKLLPRFDELLGKVPERERRRYRRGMLRWLAKVKRHLAHYARLDGDRQAALRLHRESVRHDPLNLAYWLSYAKNLVRR